MSKFTNLILQTDSYKLTHWKQIPKNTTKIMSYLESRGGLFPSTMFFGLQYYLLTYLQGQQVTKEDIQQARNFCKAHFGTNNTNEAFNLDGWNYILDKHNGKLPIKIKAVPEGTLVPVKNALMLIENTDPKVPWLTNYIETILMKVW